MTDLFPDRIETERLVLEALTTHSMDVLELYELVRTGAPHIDEVTEYLTWSPHETPNETREFLQTVTEQREAGEQATYVVRPRDEDSEIAGLTGMSVDWDRRTTTFGMWLRKPYWGRGYSGERAAALMDVAFERLDLDTVVVTVHRGNEKSKSAVSEYVEAHGGRREGLLRNFETDQDDTVHDVHRYSVAATEYRDAIENDP